MRILKVPLIVMILVSQVILPQTASKSVSHKESGVSFTGKKIGILLVNHGSRSKTWRNTLLALEDSVRDPLLSLDHVEGVKTAFMEYNEPSIATRMKEFDREGFSDVVIIPVFLTVSPHTFDDIPTIIGQKQDPTSLQMLKIEKIERYIPAAKVMIAPNLDFTSVLKSNILRRVSALSKDASNEGLVLIAYGDEAYEKEWGRLMDDVATFVRSKTGIAPHSYGWCGHIAHYDPQRTTDAINSVLAMKKKALVLPVLVAHDEMFQVKIIGDGIKLVNDHQSRVSYRPDAILPDREVQQWIIDIAETYVQRIRRTFTETVR